VHRLVGLELGPHKGVGHILPEPGDRLVPLTYGEAEEVIGSGRTLSGQGPAGQQGNQQRPTQPPRAGQRSCQRSSTPSALPSASRSTLSR
jgi:hypothetical protein